MNIFYFYLGISLFDSNYIPDKNILKALSNSKKEHIFANVTH